MGLNAGELLHSHAKNTWTYARVERRRRHELRMRSLLLTMPSIQDHTVAHLRYLDKVRFFVLDEVDRMVEVRMIAP